MSNKKDVKSASAGKKTRPERPSKEKNTPKENSTREAREESREKRREERREAKAKKQNMGSANAAKAKAKKPSSGKQTKRAPKKVTAAIPYETVFQGGIIMSSAGMYSKSYRLADVDEMLSDEQVMDNIMLNYEGLLNSIDTEMTAQITIFNRSVDPEIVKNQVLLIPKSDKFNSLREDYNQMINEEMFIGKNNLSREKYLTITVKAANIQKAAKMFEELDNRVDSIVRRINGEATTPMTIEQRLAVLYDIYNDNIDFSFEDKISPVLRNGALSLAALNKAGLTTKDLVAPASAEFSPDFFQLGDMYGRAFYVDVLPVKIEQSFLTDITELPCNMLTGISYQAIPLDSVLGQTENTLPGKKAKSRWSYLMNKQQTEEEVAKVESEALRKEMLSSNQKLFRLTFTVTIFNRDKKMLDQLSDSLRQLGVAHGISIETMMYQQQEGLFSDMPLGNVPLKINRVLTTEQAACFMPFSAKELSQNTGIYYGLNTASKNMVLYDRANAEDGNGLILGDESSGTDIIASAEILSTLLGTDDDIIIMDIDGRFRSMVKAFGGQIIDVGSDEDQLNPMDMDVQYGKDNPVALKVQFLTALCETVMGEEKLDDEMNAAIEKCGTLVYQKYYTHMQEMVRTRDENGFRVTMDANASPTLFDFYRILSNQADPKAQELASALEIYCMGNRNFFAGKNTVTLFSRITSYDFHRNQKLKDMQEFSMLVVFNDIWNRIIANKKRKKKTWVYIPDFATMVSADYVSRFMEVCLTTAGEWGGIITGIETVVENLLINDYAQKILSLFQFVFMLSQERISRVALADVYNLTDVQQGYIEDQPAGSGLLYNGINVVPVTCSLGDRKFYKKLRRKEKESED